MRFAYSAVQVLMSHFTDSAVQFFKLESVKIGFIQIFMFFAWLDYSFTGYFFLFLVVFAVYAVRPRFFCIDVQRNLPA